MISRYAVRLAACAVALGSVAPLSLRAHAQGAPFTIRRPPDGSTVRETVRVQIPHSSIGEHSFVVIYIDGKFDVALDPQRAPDSAVMNSDGSTTRATSDSRFFTYVWNTKEDSVSDGQHSIRAVLFDPVEGGVTQRATSEVKLTVANKITDGPSSLTLRYKYPEGRDMEYGRTSKSVRGGGGGMVTGVSGDQDLASMTSKLLLGILSGGNPALVRNKLTSLAVLSGGQEMTFPTSQLSNSMYQELDDHGRIRYETGTTTGLTEFSSQGLPVDNTLELPVLPDKPVSKGQTWTTDAQRIDVPGLPPSQQPKVRLQNTLVDLEWEGNYRTAKIHQHAEDVKLPGEFTFGQIPVMSATATFDRDVYVAYTSGTLVKTTRTLTIKGRTTIQPLENSSAPSFGGNGGLLNGGGRPGGVPGMMGGMGAMGGSGGPMGMAGGGGKRGGGMRGMSGMPGSGGGAMGGPGMMGGSGGGSMGIPGGGGKRGGGMPGSGGGQGFGPPGGFGGGQGFGGGGQGFTNAQPDYPVTLKAITDTHLLKITSA